MKIEPERLAIYAVTDESWLAEGESLADVVDELLRAGVTLVQLREKGADDGRFLAQARRLREVCGRRNVPLIINDRPDIARAVGAAGVHVGQSDLGIAQVRKMLGDGFIIGGSAHNVAEARAAEAAGADYLGCGAVFGSHTKQDASPLSHEELTAICESVSIPVVAIGGIGLSNVEELAGSGIAGVALVSALFAAGDKGAAVRGFADRLQRMGVLVPEGRNL